MTPEETLAAAIEKLTELRDRWLVDSRNPLFVTLDRTIDVQLAILRMELDFATKYGWPSNPFPDRVAVLALAAAILGSTS